MTNPPSKQAMHIWFDKFIHADFAILTSAASGIICLDCDKPPYPKKGIYIKTPSGGRHYWYKKRPEDTHGTNVAPGKDIPWLVKVYGTPVINAGPIPIHPPVRPVPTTTSPVIVDTSVPYTTYLNNCYFMNWYNRMKKDSRWENRYALARCYASNIVNSNAPPEIRSLGPYYRHEAEIYRSLKKPITCKFIVQSGYSCPMYDIKTDSCQVNNHSRSPYGLANSKRNPHNDG